MVHLGPPGQQSFPLFSLASHSWWTPITNSYLVVTHGVCYTHLLYNHTFTILLNNSINVNCIRRNSVNYRQTLFYPQTTNDYECERGQWYYRRRQLQSIRTLEALHNTCVGKLTNFRASYWNQLLITLLNEQYEYLYRGPVCGGCLCFCTWSTT